MLKHVRLDKLHRRSTGRKPLASSIILRRFQTAEELAQRIVMAESEVEQNRDLRNHPREPPCCSSNPLDYCPKRSARPAAAPRGIGQTLQGSFSAASKPHFASKYAFESSRRDLHNALLCTVLVGSVWVKKYTKINIEKMKSGKS